MSYPTRIVDKQIKKMEYMRHLKKLEELSSQKNHFQKSSRKERQEIMSLLKQSHKIHQKAISKIKDLSLPNTQRSNYQKVKSVVKHELDRRILTIPSKQKPDQFQIQMNNIKMVNKILNAKSQFDFKKQTNQDMSKRVVKKRRVDTSQDYSKLYENVFQNHLKQKKIMLILSKSKENVRLIVKLLNRQNILQNKTNNPYVIVIQNTKQQKQSKLYSLDQLSVSQFIFQVPPIQCKISFVQLINQKRSLRFKLTIDEKDFSQVKEKPITKDIQDTKNRVLGSASIELKKKKSRKQGKQNKDNNINFQLTQQLVNKEKMSKYQDAEVYICVP